MDINSYRIYSSYTLAVLLQLPKCSGPAALLSQQLQEHLPQLLLLPLLHRFLLLQPQAVLLAYRQSQQNYVAGCRSWSGLGQKAWPLGLKVTSFKCAHSTLPAGML
jgi:hypothetical protein